MNLTVEAAVPDVEFNEIRWKAIRGADSETPPPVRSALVRGIFQEDNDQPETCFTCLTSR